MSSQEKNKTITLVLEYKKFFDSINEEDFKKMSKDEIISMLKKIEKTLK